MHFVIERRGGLAGLTASCTLDSAALDPADRETLEQLLDTDEPLTADQGTDRFTYRVTRHNTAGTTTREIPESVMPPAVASVVTPDI